MKIFRLLRTTWKVISTLWPLHEYWLLPRWQFSLNDPYHQHKSTWTYCKFENVNLTKCNPVIGSTRISHPEVFYQKGFFFIKDTLEQVFSCKFWKISKKTFYYRTPSGDYFWSTRTQTCTLSFLPMTIKNMISLFTCRCITKLFCNRNHWQSC